MALESWVDLVNKLRVHTIALVVTMYMCNNGISANNRF